MHTGEEACDKAMYRCEKLWRAEWLSTDIGRRPFDWTDWTDWTDWMLLNCPEDSADAIGSFRPKICDNRVSQVIDDLQDDSY